MYLDIIMYIQVHSKMYVSRKVKTYIMYNLKWRGYYI